MSSGAGQRLAGFRVEYTLLTLPPGTTVGATSCLDTPEDCCVGSSGSSGSGSGSLGCAAFDADWPDTLDLVVSGATNPDCSGTFTLTWDGWRYLLERSLVDPPDCVDLAQDPGPYTLTYLLEEWDGGIRFRMTLEGSVQVYGEAVADDLAGTCCPAIDLVGSVDYPCCGLGTLDIGISGACAGGSSGSSGSGSGGTVTVECCPDALAETVYATLGSNVDCTCLEGVVIPLVWDAAYPTGEVSPGAWVGEDASAGSCGHKLTLVWYCGGGGLAGCNDMRLDLIWDDGASCMGSAKGTGPDTCTCSPPEFVYTMLLDGSGCGCEGSGSIQVTITE